MDAVVALTGQRRLAADRLPHAGGRALLGGTYFPPEPRHGLPSLPQVLIAVAEALPGAARDVVGKAQGLADAMQQAAAAAPSAEPLSEGLLHAAVRGLVARLDPEWGGWGRAPKFRPRGAGVPAPARRGRAAEKTLDGMAPGGMYDLVGGGFHRYSVDARWLVPHFEKMLYDNALLARVPARLARAREGPLPRGRGGDARLHAARARLQGGGFASAQDADTDGVEGLTFTWTRSEGVPAELLAPFEPGRTSCAASSTRSRGRGSRAPRARARSRPPTTR